MGRPHETSNKKDLEKKRLQKRQEKAERKEERKGQAKSGKSFEDMLAYVDENGNITSTPPDLSKKKTIQAEDIVISSRNTGVDRTPEVRTGKVTFFNESKGFGFIKDSASGESIFVHINQLSAPLRENDRVSFETEQGFKGPTAKNVKLLS